VEVTFDIDANGIINVTALDKATSKSQNITITASSGLSDEEVEKMRKDAEAHADEDAQLKSMVEARNTADNAIYTAEKTVKDLGDKVSDENKKSIEEGLVDLRSKLESDDAAEITRSTEALMEHVQKLGAEAYQAGEAAPSGDAEQSAGESDEDVVDGEFKENGDGTDPEPDPAPEADPEPESNEEK
jgi:molecular chaperone DnaK